MTIEHTNALLQGLFNCGGYERGHAFIKDHAAEITPEFVSALRTTSMNLLTGDEAEPSLAPIFASLAFVAAVVLNDDHEKGMSRYCEGSILARLGNLRQAIARFEEAADYLRLGTNSQELANCLYDNAICHDKLGELSRAVMLIEESLSHQTDEEQRGQARAYLLVLEKKSGNLETEDDFRDYIQRILKK